MKDKNKLKSITKTNIDKNSKNNKSETNMPKKKKVTN